jgi:hypothetical protein
VVGQVEGDCGRQPNAFSGKTTASPTVHIPVCSNTKFGRWVLLVPECRL